jgi:dihydropteroate synthase type 2
MYLNNIQGFPDPAVHAELADSDCRLIVTHSVQRAGPATRVATDPEKVTHEIGCFFTDRIAELQAASP